MVIEMLLPSTVGKSMKIGHGRNKSVSLCSLSMFFFSFVFTLTRKSSITEKNMRLYLYFSSLFSIVSQYPRASYRVYNLPSFNLMHGIGYCDIS